MKANGQTNSIMPIMNVLGYVPYVIVAIWGAYMAIVPVTNLGLAVTGTMAFGMITSFLTLTGNFINPISQIANQFNSIIIVLAGTERIFVFMEEYPPEVDDGYVTLVNESEEHGKII